MKLNNRKAFGWLMLSPSRPSQSGTVVSASYHWVAGCRGISKVDSLTKDNLWTNPRRHFLSHCSTIMPYLIASSVCRNLNHTPPPHRHICHMVKISFVHFRHPTILS
jgi:hypothetical protein